jgi:hypothetical protein
MLRLVSAVLHLAPGEAVSEVQLDLRPAEVAIVGTLAVALVALSFWPAAITDRVFGGEPARAVETGFEGRGGEAAP